jgi:hypothetical protein
MTESNKDSLPYLLFLATVTTVIAVIIAWMMSGSDRKPPAARDCNAITLEDRNRNCLPSEDQSRD